MRFFYVINFAELNKRIEEPFMLYKLVPRPIKKIVYEKLRLLMRAYRFNVNKEIPLYSLNEKHIGNLKVLVNRTALLEVLPKGGDVAEIGVHKGEFAKVIWDISAPKKLHLIDSWGDPNRSHAGLKNLVEEKFKDQIAESRVDLNVGLSTAIIPTFPANYFDWVYADTDHSYSLTIRELNLLKDKIKPNGIIAGHDYTLGNWVDDVRYGVVEAVHEFCVKENWEIIYLTIETDHYKSFAIRKL